MQKRTRPATILAVVFGILVCVVVVEFLSRLLFQVVPGTWFLDEEGQAIGIEAGELGLKGNLLVRQLAPDYDAVARTTVLGLRAPSADVSPKVVLLGDSFTFGLGLADGETFAALYCSRLGLQCANLGHPGTATRRQRQSLELMLAKEEWRPREVHLFLLGMSTALFAGNDFFENVAERRADDAHARSSTEPASRANVPSSGGRLRRVQALLLGHSNLARLLYLHFGQWMRTVLAPAPGVGEFEFALEATRDEIMGLGRLANEVCNACRAEHSAATERAIVSAKC